MTTPPGSAPTPSPAERLSRSLAGTAALLALATVALVEIGLVRELLAERETVVGLAAATAALALAVAFAAPRLVRHLRQGRNHGFALPPERAKPTVQVAVGLCWSAGGFASYPTWSEWFFAAAVGVFVGYFIVPIVLDRLALRVAPPVRPADAEEEGKP